MRTQSSCNIKIINGYNNYNKTTHFNEFIIPFLLSFYSPPPKVTPHQGPSDARDVEASQPQHLTLTPNPP